MGKGVLCDDSEYSLFATGIHRRDYVNCGIDRADLIITIGYNIVEYPPYVWNRNLDKKIINIDFVEAETDKYFNPAIEVVGDISCALALLGELVTPRKNGDVFKAIRTFLSEKLALDVEKQYPPTPQEVVRHVRNALGHDDILTLDNGIYKLWFARLYKTYKPNTFLVDNALATMGAGLPAGLAAKMLHPDRKVLAVVGDGGFMMNSQEIETALRYNIPLVVLLLNDNAFGFIKWEQQAKGSELRAGLREPRFREVRRELRRRRHEGEQRRRSFGRSEGSVFTEHVRARRMPGRLFRQLRDLLEGAGEHRVRVLSGSRTSLPSADNESLS